MPSTEKVETEVLYKSSFQKQDGTWQATIFANIYLFIDGVGEQGNELTVKGFGQTETSALKNADFQLEQEIS